MTVPNIDTFEHDIREEIKNKEASIGDIASASGAIGNTGPIIARPTGTSKALIIIACIMILFIIAGFGYLAYVYTASKPATKQQAASLVDEQVKSQNTEKLIADKLTAVSPALSKGVSHFTSQVDTNAYGTALTLDSYPSTFAFMIKNETAIASEILADEIKKYDNSTTTPDLTFTDVTVSNQNMRTLTVGSRTLVYAFFGEQYLAISDSAENILQMRGALIK